MLTASLIKDLI